MPPFQGFFHLILCSDSRPILVNNSSSSFSVLPWSAEWIYHSWSILPVHESLSCFQLLATMKHTTITFHIHSFYFFEVKNIPKTGDARSANKYTLILTRNCQDLLLRVSFLSHSNRWQWLLNWLFLITNDTEHLELCIINISCCLNCLTLFPIFNELLNLLLRFESTIQFLKTSPMLDI